MSDPTIGFIGAGQMARALAGGFLARGLIEPARLVAADPAAEARARFADGLPGVSWLESNSAVVRRADVVILAVKPQVFSRVAGELDESTMAGKLFISILAGVTLRTLCPALRTERVVRVMPNTPCLVGRGASAYSLGAGATREDGRLVETLFASVGTAFEVAESQLDAVTGLSGSGPAYVFLLIEALSDGGVRMGLPRSAATMLAAQTLAGAAEMVLQTGAHPAELKDRVASPAGTTIAGLQVLERRGVRSALIDAVEAATLRSRELGSQE